MTDKDYIRIRKKALLSKTSVYLEVKRELCYKKCSHWSINCQRCHNLRPSPYNKDKYQCSIVGESTDFYSDISLNFVCREFTRLPEKNNHDYKKYIMPEVKEVD